ncbi:MAG: DUF6465 family protein [Clostridiales bacterium]|jgi:hypothetical protein|nr:DUF6465 family protein [Clostridiales bacterium]
MKTEFFIELNGRQTNYKTLTDTAKEIWKGDGHLLKDLESLELYFKPAENSCYYVINGIEKGNFFL